MNVESRFKLFEAFRKDLDNNLHFKMYELYGSDMRHLLMPSGSNLEKFQHAIQPLSKLKRIMQANLNDTIVKKNNNDDDKTIIDINLDKSCGVLLSKSLELFILELTANSVVLCRREQNLSIINDDKIDNFDNNDDEKTYSLNENHVRKALQINYFNFLNELQSEIDLSKYESDFEDNDDNNNENNLNNNEKGL